MEDPTPVRKESLIAAALVIVGIFAALFILLPKFMSNESPYETMYYNNYKFEKVDNMWYTQWQKGDNLFSIPLRYNPLEVKDVPIVGNLSSEFNRPEVFIAFDPTQGNFSILSLAAGELSLNLNKALLVTPIAACSVDDPEVCEDRPIVSTNCTEHNASIIFIRDVGKPAILLEGNCVYLGGKGFDLLKSVDRLLYQWYGIM